MKGLSYAFGASFALAISLALSKSLLNSINLIQFGFLWFVFAALYNIFLYSYRNHTSGVFIHSRKVWKTTLIIALPDAVASFLFFVAVQRMENPAIVSFIGNLAPVLVTILGITLLREKFGTIQLLGIILTLSGVFILSFNKGSVIQPGSGYAVLAAGLFALCTILGRSRRESLNPELLSALRSWMLLLFFAAWMIMKSEDLQIDKGILTKVAIGSFLESLITIIFNYQALRYIEASRTSLILSSKALWLLIIAYLFLNAVPPVYQIISGFLTIAGLILISSRFNEQVIYPRQDIHKKIRFWPF